MNGSPQISRHDDLAAISAGDWNDLVARSATRTVFQTWQWHRAWWQVYGRDNELLLLAARDRGQLVGVAALCRDASGVLRFVGHARSDYVDLLYPHGVDGIREALWRAVLQHAGHWRRLELRYLPADSPTAATLAALGLPALVDSVPCPTLRIDSPDALDRVRAKKSLRRHHAWFRRQPGALVEHLRLAEHVLPHLEALFDQHCRRWRETPHPSLFHDAEHRRFYHAATEHLGPTGWLRFTRLSIAGVACAFHFGFVHDRVLTWYKPSFEIELARHSPGEALLAELLGLVADEGLHELDFSVGDEPFKRRFTNHVRHNLVATLFASSLDHRCAQALRAGKAALRPLLAWARRPRRS